MVSGSQNSCHLYQNSTFTTLLYNIQITESTLYCSIFQGVKVDYEIKMTNGPESDTFVHHFSADKLSTYSCL